MVRVLVAVVAVSLLASCSAYNPGPGSFLGSLSASASATESTDSGGCKLIEDLKRSSAKDKLKTNGVFAADKNSKECKDVRSAYAWMQYCIKTSSGSWGNGPCSGLGTYTNMQNHCASWKMKMTNGLTKLTVDAATRCKAMNPTPGALFGCLAICGRPMCAGQCLRHSFLAMCGVEGKDDSWSDIILNPPGEDIPPPKPAVPVQGSLEGKSKDEVNSILCNTVKNARQALKECNEANKSVKDAKVFLKCFNGKKALESKLPIWTVIEKRAKYMNEKGKGAERLTQNDVAKCFAKCYAGRTDNPSWFERMTGNVKLDACDASDCTKGSFCDVCSTQGKAWEPSGGWP